MAQKRHGVDQIIPMLRRADVELGKGKKVPEVCKRLGITQQTAILGRAKCVLILRQDRSYCGFCFVSLPC